MTTATSKTKGRDTKRKPLRVPIHNAAGEATDWIEVPPELQSTTGTPVDKKTARYFAKNYPEPRFTISEIQRMDVAYRSTIKPIWNDTIEPLMHDPATKELVWNYENLPLAEPRDPSPDLTPEIRRKAHEIGFIAIAFARFERTWVYSDRLKRAKFKNVIIGVVEQPWDITQRMPDLESVIGEIEAEHDSTKKGIALADFIRAKGYAVQFHYASLSGITSARLLPYATQAGLGQMGANGQLLTPLSGSRCLFALLSTNAPVSYDKPVDYGISRLCEECQVCVRRCPGRAISDVKLNWRGVVKHKVNMDRCLPLVLRYAGCNVCTKVCPVQKYGLKSVLDHYRDTGRILGKGTDELEGFTLDGKGHFPVGRLPRFTVAEGGKGFEVMADKLGVPETPSSALMARATRPHPGRKDDRRDQISIM